MARVDVDQKGVEIAEAPLFFAGQPPELTGHLEVRNRSEERFKIREVSLTNLQLKGAHSAGIKFTRSVEKIGPGAKARVPIRLQLSPDTPPGTYEGQIECDRERRSVTVQVLESWKVELLPSALSFKVSSRKPISATIRITNVGNMPYRLQREVELIWEPKRCSQHGVLEAMARGGEAHLREKSGEPDMEHEIKGMIAIGARDRHLRLGETREITLTISVPDRLKPGRLYCGCVPFEQSRLRLELEVLEDVKEG
jgi:hypothetical protein